MRFANAAMLLGLLGIAVPVVIHLLARRRVPTIDWAAMRFLDAGDHARTRARLSGWPPLLARMLAMALIALAAARPLLSGGPADADGGPRDIVLVIDGSAPMGSRGGLATPFEEALSWARHLVSGLRPGDRVALVRAGAVARPLIDEPTDDRERIRSAIDAIPPPAGPGDLGSAIDAAFCVLQRSRNPATRVVVLTDGRRAPWRPDDDGRWALLRELRDRLPAPPRIEAIAFAPEVDPEAADGSVSALRLSHHRVSAGAPVTVEASIRNAGPAPLERSAELLIDGTPAAGVEAVDVGPIPPSGRAAVAFRAVLDGLGPHALTVRLAPGRAIDPSTTDDSSSAIVEVAEAPDVLLVDGEPGPGPLDGETDFLRAALDPPGIGTPFARPATIGTDAFDPVALGNRDVIVLANVDRLSPEESEAVADFLERGGGVLVLPGDRTDPAAWNAACFEGARGWLPARIGPTDGRFGAGAIAARPSPSSFEGGVLGPLGLGQNPALGTAGLFAAFALEPAATSPPAEVLGRLDSGGPWLVERPFGAGRAAIMAGPLDAEGGTLPANPDFVPLVHELIAHLADPGPDLAANRPGEPLDVPIGAAPAGLDRIVVRTPSGRLGSASIDRSGGVAVARFEATDEPGLYRFEGPGGPHLRVVRGGDIPADPDPLGPDDVAALAGGWPLAFNDDPDALAASLRDDRSGIGPRPLWRGLVLAALGGLCVEAWLTRREARRRLRAVAA